MSVSGVGWKVQSPVSASPSLLVAPTSTPDVFHDGDEDLAANCPTASDRSPEADFLLFQGSPMEFAAVGRGGGGNRSWEAPPLLHLDGSEAAAEDGDGIWGNRMPVGVGGNQMEEPELAPCFSRPTSPTVVFRPKRPKTHDNARGHGLLAPTDSSSESKRLLTTDVYGDGRRRATRGALEMERGGGGRGEGGSGWGGGLDDDSSVFVSHLSGTPLTFSRRPSREELGLTGCRGVGAARPVTVSDTRSRTSARAGGAGGGSGGGGGQCYLSNAIIAARGDTEQHKGVRAHTPANTRPYASATPLENSSGRGSPPFARADYPKDAFVLAYSGRDARARGGIGGERVRGDDVALFEMVGVCPRTPSGSFGLTLSSSITPPADALRCSRPSTVP